MSKFSPSKHSSIRSWTEAELVELPGREDDTHEYKSSRADPATVKGQLGRAASAFWNSGGGLFVVGVDDWGEPDGGIEPVFGVQSIRDWVDQVLHQVEPVADYTVATVAGEGRLKIEPGRVVLLVGFGPSHLPPHMAPDGRYYLRAGAHTVPARQFVVESLWTRRRLQSPALRTVLRRKPDSPGVIELGVVALNETPALDVELTLRPVPRLWKRIENPFPLCVGVVDRRNPFYVDLTFAEFREEEPQILDVVLVYRDVSGREFREESRLDLERGIGPWKLSRSELRDIDRRLESIQRTMEKMVEALRGRE